MPMVEGCEDFRFTLEASHAVAVPGKRFRQNLQRHVTAEPRVACAVDFAHPACTDRRQKFKWPEFCSNRLHHCFLSAAGQFVTSVIVLSVSPSS